MDLVRSLGADHVVDYATTDYTKAGKRYDWIVDVDSHHGPLAVRRALKPDGVYVTLGGTGRTIITAALVGAVMTLASKRWMGLLIWWKPFHGPDVDRIKELIAAGQVRPVIDRRYPLHDVVAALRWVDDGHARGKVIVTP
jgi:NADPH:quinone reductase-like Zn-dependent oxidoreductase